MLNIVSNKTFQLESFGITDIGCVREHNEDNWLSYPEKGLFVLADGMGGHAGGEIASKEVSDFLYQTFENWNPTAATSSEDAKSFLYDSLIKANLRIYEKGKQEDALRGMGTTVCCLLFHKNEAILAHVGDSRIYRLHASHLQQLTVDHSLVAELLALGAMQPNEVETFPYKHILTRAIGTHPSVEPSIHTAQVYPHDIFLLCSDGLTNYTSDAQISNILQADVSLPAKGHALIDLANEQGGGDNITLIIVDANHDLSRQ